MSQWAISIARIFVKAEIELSSVLNNGLIERRQQHMVVVVHLRYRHN
jgi:hypothetical protein